MPNWKPTEPVHPLDAALYVDRSRQPFTTGELLRILAVNGFVQPTFECAIGNGFEHRRCTVVGPDGERHLAGRVLEAIFRAERLERLCQNRSDVVMGLLARSKMIRALERALDAEG